MSGRLVVVGAGILGTMHAWHGLRRGYEVLHLERDAIPRGASVRNFGLVWIGGRAVGKELALALRARELWNDVAADCPSLSLRADGSLTIARNAEEGAVLEHASALGDAKERGFSLLSPAEAREKNPALTGELHSALFCATDAIVEPRLTLGMIRQRLLTNDAYALLPSRHVLEVRAHAVRDHEGTWHEGDLVVCCPGASPGGLLATFLADAPLRRVRLQMLETAPFHAPFPTALADGDSLRYYPAYAGEALRALSPQQDVAQRWAAQLLCVKRVSGHLTIGDTHTYEEPFAFDLTDEPYDHLLSVATALLGTLPPVERRWAGVYSQVTDDALLYLRKEVAPGVFVVTGPGGRGMTMSPAIAEETFT